MSQQATQQLGSKTVSSYLQFNPPVNIASLASDALTTNIFAQAFFNALDLAPAGSAAALQVAATDGFSQVWSDLQSYLQNLGASQAIGDAVSYFQ